MTSEQSQLGGGAQSALSGHTILLRYVVFAVAAGLVNLATQQAVVLVISPAAPIMVSLSAGTAVGFIFKYWLDKHYIFLDGYHGPMGELRKVVLYAAFSVATTLIFWVFELGFWHTFRSVEAKYAGAVLGLALGNWLKYLVDKVWTFRGAANDDSLWLGPFSPR